jgi:hypothetical protein
MENPTRRARILLRCLPKTLDESKGGKLTRLFLQKFGDSELGGTLMVHFWTGGWSGPESEHFTAKRDEARRWVSEVKSGKVVAWLYRYMEALNELIARAEIREERGFS